MITSMFIKRYGELPVLVKGLICTRIRHSLGVTSEAPGE